MVGVPVLPEAGVVSDPVGDSLGEEDRADGDVPGGRGATGSVCAYVLRNIGGGRRENGGYVPAAEALRDCLKIGRYAVAVALPSVESAHT